VTKFPEPPEDDYAFIYLEDTDRPLPAKLTPRTRYAYFKTIARGGKCIVQSCKDMHLGRTICYKKLRPEFEDDPIEQRRFVREARVSAMLQHPNTIPTYELGRDAREHYYFTMKLVHGYTLREVLNFRERYDFHQLIDVLTQVGQALGYAHSHHVIHRDLKPENILVGPFGEVLLMDWGLAKVWRGAPAPPDARPEGPGSNRRLAAEAQEAEPDSSLTGRGALQGTAAYMSPEQIRRDPAIDYRSDIFSFGVMLYEVLCGRTPWEAGTVREMTERIVGEEPVRPSRWTRTTVPPLLEDLAMGCIGRDPAARIQECPEIVRQLREHW